MAARLGTVIKLSTNMRFGTNKNLNRNNGSDASPKEKSHQPLRLTGGGEKNYKGSGLVDGLECDKKKSTKEEKGDYSLFYFVTTFIVGFLAIEIVILSNGVRFNAKSK